MAAKPQIIRLLTLGDSGAGKSSLLLRYTQNEFNVEYMPTIGIDFRLKTVEVNGKTVKVQVWVRRQATQREADIVLHRLDCTTNGCMETEAAAAAAAVESAQARRIASRLVAGRCPAICAASMPLRCWWLTGSC